MAPAAAAFRLLCGHGLTLVQGESWGGSGVGGSPAVRCLRLAPQPASSVAARWVPLSPEPLQVSAAVRGCFVAARGSGWG